MRLIAQVIVFIALGSQYACTSAPENHSEVMANGRPVGEIRGIALVNAQIKKRLLTQESAEAFQIERVAGQEIYSLRGLLGEYSTGGAHSEFRGGEPNPFGLLLWHQVGARFAEGLSKLCDSPQGARNVQFLGTGSFTLTDAFADKLVANCNKDLSETELKTNASGLWRAFMGIGAGTEEGPWVDAFAAQGGELTGMSGAERVSAMILTMVLNPHFLLEK